MTEVPAAEPSSASPLAPRVVAWLFSSLACTVLAIVVGINLPARVKLLGLFALCWAGLLGIGLRWLADASSVKPQSWSHVVVALLSAGLEISIVFGGWIQYRSQLQKQIAAVPSLESMRPMTLPPVSGAVPPPTQASPSQEASDWLRRSALEAELNEKLLERQRIQMQLSTYLYRRLLSLGDFPFPVPELFWACEIILGTVAGIWCWRKIPISNQDPSQSVSP